MIPCHKIFHILLFTFTFLHLVSSPTAKANFDGQITYNVSSIQNMLFEKSSKDDHRSDSSIALSVIWDDCSMHIEAAHEQFRHTSAERFAALSMIATTRLIL